MEGHLLGRRARSHRRRRQQLPTKARLPDVRASVARAKQHRGPDDHTTVGEPGRPGDVRRIPGDRRAQCRSCASRRRPHVRSSVAHTPVRASERGGQPDDRRVDPHRKIRRSHGSTSGGQRVREGVRRVQLRERVRKPDVDLQEHPAPTRQPAAPDRHARHPNRRSIQSEGWRRGGRRLLDRAARRGPGAVCDGVHPAGTAEPGYSAHPSPGRRCR